MGSKEILFAIWFFLPAGLANAAPVFVNKIPLLNRWRTPLDFGFRLRGKRLFGPHKTWRGLLSGMALGSLVAVTQRYSYNHLDFVQDITYLNYSVIHVGLLGAMLGAGALLGDAVESFFKRQLGVPSGHRWFPFDQTDYIIGGLLVSLIVIRLPFHRYFVILLTWFFMHLLAGPVAYALHLKRKPL